jgi:serine/threonine-protein kinase RsbW
MGVEERSQTASGNLPAKADARPSLPRSLRAALGALVALLLVSLAAAVYAVRRVNDSANRTYATDVLPLQTAVRGLVIGMLNEETGFRGYLITAREPSLQPLTTGRRETAAALATLGGRTAESSRFAQLVATARNQAQGLEVFYDGELKLAHRDAAGLAQARANVEEGTARFDAFRRTADSMLAETANVTHQAQQRRDHETAILIASLVALAAAVLLIGAILFQRVPRRVAAALDGQYQEADRANRFRDQAIALQRMAEALGEAETPSEAADTFARLGIELLGAKAGAVWMLDETGGLLRVVQTETMSDVRVTWSEVAVSVNAPVGTVVREGRPVYLGTAAEIERRYPELIDVRRQLGDEAWVALPLSVGPHQSGVLVVTFDAPQTFSEDERSLLAAVALRVAAALERSRLREARRRSLEEERILTGLADALADCASRAQVHAALTSQLGVVGATACAVALPGATGASVDVVVTLGDAAGELGGPLADAMRSRREVLDHTDPLAPQLYVPVGEGRRPAGGVALRFRRPIGQPERPLLRRFAARCLAAVERVMLIEAEQAARATAERLRRISQRLSTALAAVDVAAVIVDEVQAAMAAGAVVVAAQEEGHLRRLAAVAADDAPAAEAAIAEAMRVKRPVTVETVLATPLIVRGEVIGGLAIERSDAAALPSGELALLEAIAGQCAQALQRAMLFDAEHDARMQAQVLERHSTHIAAAATERAVADATVADLAELGAGTAGIYVLRTEWVELLAVRGVSATIAEQYARLPLDEPTPAAEAIRLAEAIECESRDALVARYPGLAAVAEQLQLESLAAIPLRTADGRIIGSLRISSSERDWLTASRRRVLAGIAEQAGVALERAALLERERAARRLAEALEQRAMRLQELTALLAAATDVASVARLVVRDFVEAVGGIAGSIFLLDERAAMLRLVDRHGPPGASVSGREIPLDAPVPGAQAIRIGAPILLGDAETARLRFPTATDAARLAERPDLGRAWAHLPLTAAVRPIGILVVAYADPQPFDTVQQAHLLAAAAAAGQALQRAALIEAERQARESDELIARIAAELAVTIGHQAQRELTVELLAERLFDAAAIVVQDEPAHAAGRLANGLLAALEADAALRSAVTTGRRVSPVIVDGGGLHVLVRPLEGDRDDPSVLVMAREAGTPFTAADVALAGEIVVRLAAALDRSRLYDHEHEVSTRLQSSLVSGQDSPPPSVGVSQHYLPGHDRLHVGGDWTDIVVLDERRIALTVGDVVGRGIDAAAAMGRLRSALAAILLVSQAPGEAIDRLEVFAARVAGADYATVAVCMIDTGTGEVTYSCAGHPPPLVLVDGTATYLWDARSAPLRAGTTPPRPTARTQFEAPFTVMLYTDGLVERRTRPLDTGLAELAEAAVANADLPLDDLRDRILAAVHDASDELRDDSAILLAQLVHLDARVFSRTITADPAQLGRLRSALRSWLAAHDVGAEVAADVLLAVGEATANAVEHAYLDSGGEITVELEIDGERISGSVRDHGSWREPDERDGRGRGLAIIQAVTEAVELDRREGGTTLSFDCLIGSEMPA